MEIKVNKNQTRTAIYVRISTAQQKQVVELFMTLKGYLIIALMMSLGITLRKVGGIPEAFFSFFYTGLGAALFLAGTISLFKKK